MFISFTLIFCLSICLWVALTFEFFLPNLNFPHFSCIADCDMIFCMGVYYHILNKLQIKFKIFAFWLIFLCSYWTENLNIIGSVIHITISGLKSIILQYSQNACLNKNQKKIVQAIHWLFLGSQEGNLGNWWGREVYSYRPKFSHLFIY